MASFELPITSISNTKMLNKEVVDDLELLTSCKEILCPTTMFGEKTVCLWTRNYTSNVEHLKDTQALLRRNIPTIHKSHINEVSNVSNVWNQIVSMNTDTDTDNGATNVNDITKEENNNKNNNNNNNNNNEDLGFHAKYQYIDWKWLRPLNNNSQFLQWISLYNMTTPVLSLCLPIFFFILPFFILRFQGTHITFSKYFEILKVVFRRHQIGQLFSISSATWDKRVYILVSMVFYVLQIYQNVRSCISFTRNMKHIHEQLFILRNHITNTLEYMNNYETQTKDLESYEDFLANMKLHRYVLSLTKDNLERVRENTLSISKAKQIGHVMKCFYQLYNNRELKASLEYSFSFCGYIDNLGGIKRAISNGLLGKCKFSKRKTKFYGAYYPVTHVEPVKNTYDIDRHHLITGPNAAGKTTLLKATMFNIVFSQQIGYGCYEKATLAPFEHIHCYINIPDTSGRDSLFQAEARRCKDILEIVKTTNPKERHFCVFDELYSGTNPYEAIGSAAAYLTHLNKHPNVVFMLTTHFLGLCHRLEKQRRFRNCHMSVARNGEDFHYTYKLTKGISNVKGGVKVLKDLEYPDEIIRETKEVISNITF